MTKSIRCTRMCTQWCSMNGVYWKFWVFQHQTSSYSCLSHFWSGDGMYTGNYRLLYNPSMIKNWIAELRVYIHTTNQHSSGLITIKCHSILSIYWDDTSYPVFNVRNHYYIDPTSNFLTTTRLSPSHILIFVIYSSNFCPIWSITIYMIFPLLLWI